MSTFELITSVDVGYDTEIRKYKSLKTGLTVVLAKTEVTKIIGQLIFATEAENNDGLPNAVASLINFGSEDYPYPGVLDMVANRCLSDGSVWWVEIDHTSFKVETVNSEGFLTLLPIFLDHLLYPLLSESGYITNIHHITGNGEDSGILYNKLKSYENTEQAILKRTINEAAYPNTGYDKEVAGYLKNLRSNINIDKIRDFHTHFYRPENLTLIISGNIESEDIFKALESMEKKIESKGDREPYTKPWQTPISPLEDSVTTRIKYPSNDDSNGTISINYRGPSNVDDYLQVTGCSLMMDYLTSEGGPFYKELIDVDDNYTDKITASVQRYSETLLGFHISNVPLDSMDDVQEKLLEILEKLAYGDEKIDIARIHNIIEKEITELHSRMESCLHSIMSFPIIENGLYGKSDDDFQERTNLKKRYEHFLSVEEDYWIDLLRTYFIGGKYVSVHLIPSSEEQDRISEKESERISMQKSDFSEEFLREKEQQLEEAIASNEKEPPESLFEQIAIPSLDSIKFPIIKTYKSIDKDVEIHCLDFNDFPLYAEFYNVPSKFIIIKVTLNTNSLSLNLRPYLPLFLSLIWQSPVQRGDFLITHEEVLNCLRNETIRTDNYLGIDYCRTFCQTATLFVEVDTKEYENGVNWIMEILFSTVFEKERILSCILAMNSKLSMMKKQANILGYELLYAMFYRKESNIYHYSILRQEKFMHKIYEEMEEPEDAEIIIGHLNSLREELLQQKNIALHVAAPLDKMNEINKNLTNPWRNIDRWLNISYADELKLTAIPDSKLIERTGIYPDIQGQIVGCNYFKTANIFIGIPSIDDPMHQDLPGLMLCVQYFKQFEGPLRRTLHSKNLASECCLSHSVTSGLLTLAMNNSPDSAITFTEAKSLMEKQCSSNESWNKNLLETGRCALLYNMIEKGDDSMIRNFKCVPENYTFDLIQRVREVTIEKLNETCKKYFIPLFSKCAKIIIICHPSNIQEEKITFSKMGYKLTTALTLEESILGE